MHKEGCLACVIEGSRATKSCDAFLLACRDKWSLILLESAVSFEDSG